MMLGLMFGQTEWKTKVFNKEFTNFSGGNELVDIAEDFNEDIPLFEYYFLRLIKATDENNNVILGEVEIYCDSPSFINSTIQCESNYCHSSDEEMFPSTLIRFKKLGHYGYINFHFAITGHYYDDTDTEQGDLNDDSNIDVLDVVNLVDLILFGNADPSQLFDAMKRF